MEKYYSVKQAAEMLGKSKWTIYSWLAKGEKSKNHFDIPHHKIRSSVVFTESDLKSIIK